MRIAALSRAAAAASLAILSACEKKNPPTQFVGKETPSVGAPAHAPPPAQPAPPARAPAGAVAAGGLAWAVPDGWTSRPPSSSARILELVAPGPDGSGASAELVALMFGPGGAGSVEDNLERWARQVLDDAGEPVLPHIVTMESGPLFLTVMSSTGTFLSGMPGQDPTPRSGWTLLAAIVEKGPKGPVYVRMTGPKDVVERHRAAFENLLRSLVPAE